MNEFLTAKRTSYAAHRAASQGAGITLVCDAECYVASFECAQRIYKCIPGLALQITGEVPTIRIPLDRMHEACTKLSALYSVALIDHARDRHKESRFYCIWRINKQGSEQLGYETIEFDELTPEQEAIIKQKKSAPLKILKLPQPSKNVDDY